jgi:hypothetical protein
MCISSRTYVHWDDLETWLEHCLLACILPRSDMIQRLSVPSSYPNQVCWSTETKRADMLQPTMTELLPFQITIRLWLLVDGLPANARLPHWSEFAKRCALTSRAGTKMESEARWSREYLHQVYRTVATCSKPTGILYLALHSPFRC